MQAARNARLAWRQRQAEIGKSQSFSASVATALGVISGLIASALLAVLLSPPDAVYNPESWSRNSHTDMQVACFSAIDPPNTTVCRRWSRVYGFSAALALMFQLTTLLLTISIAMGFPDKLVLAVLCFVAGLWCSVATVMATFWLSSSKLVAIFATTSLCAFLIASLRPLAPAFVFIIYKVFFKSYSLESAGLPPFLHDSVSLVHLAIFFSAHRFWGRLSNLLLIVIAQTEDLDEFQPLGVPPLFFAASLGRTQAVRILLEAGADPEHTSGGATPLHVAAGGGEYEIVKLLLLNLANPNEFNRDRQTPLDLTCTSMAEKADAIRVGRLLRDYGAEFGTLQPADCFILALEDVRARNHRLMARKSTSLSPYPPPINDDIWVMHLYRAATLGHASAVRFVLDKLYLNRAYIFDERNEDPWPEGGGEYRNTPLSQAAVVGELEAVRAFRAWAAAHKPGMFIDDTSNNNQGQSPLDLALDAGHPDVVEELRDWEKKGS